VDACAWYAEGIAVMGRWLPSGFTEGCLAGALMLSLLACLPLGLETQGGVFRYLAVVDITRSMNVTDYRYGDRMISRLDFVKQELRSALTRMPCGSRLALGVFTERNTALMFEPIEVCEGFQDIDEALQRLDWRMAWAADSRIASGLLDAFKSLAGYEADLLFFTDGQEAPPVNLRYKTRFEEVRGHLRGVLVGVGGTTPMPIPKFDNAGKSIGFMGEEDVPQRSTFGLSEMAPEDIEGYHARNAPFGNAPSGGTEHLSALKEDYLMGLAHESGLGYLRLEAGSLAPALLDASNAKSARVYRDLRWVPASLALMLLVLAYAGTALITRRIPVIAGFQLGNALQFWRRKLHALIRPAGHPSSSPR
jgi:mxaL protein